MSYSYDETGRLTGLVNRNSGSQGISSNSYLLDGAGNRLSNTTQRGTDNYYYDVKYQLTSATHPTLASESYAYDTAGNRTVGHGYSNWTYNLNNQLTGYNSVTYGYDANGNMTSATDAGGTTTYSYDYENRLVQVNFPGGGGVTTYKYDGQGRRIEKNVNGTITRYLYNGADPIAEYDGAGAVQAKYLHGRGWGEPLAMTRGSEVYWYHGDGLGSVTEVTDAVEDVVEQYVYDSFGNLHIYDGTGNPLSQTAIGNYFTYIGREYDQESALYYLRARYYSPEQGRFLARDPIINSRILSPFLSQNLYRYADNNPASRKDPTGLKCTSGSIQYTRSPIVLDRGAPTTTFKASAETSCRSCMFIQEMGGDLRELPSNKCVSASFPYWGGNTPLLCFGAWFVDKTPSQTTAYYADTNNFGRLAPNTISMSDQPRLPGNNPRKCTLTFKVGVYEDGKHTVNPASGALIGPEPVSGPIYWYFHWETDANGTILWSSP